MTGRLFVDGAAGVERLVYSSDRAERSWDRLVVGFAGDGELVVRDPRLLGWVELGPDEAVLGPDATVVTVAELRAALLGFIAVWNDRAHPFCWSFTGYPLQAEETLARSA